MEKGFELILRSEETLDIGKIWKIVKKRVEGRIARN